MSDPVERKFQRAVVLIQLLINADPEDYFDIEDEVREQLEAWGIKTPERVDVI